MVFNIFSQIDSAIKIWKINDCEHWIGVDFAETMKAAVTESGLNYSEVIDCPREVHRCEWRNKRVTEFEEKYSPSYTYDNFILKLADEEKLELPMLFCTTEY